MSDTELWLKLAGLACTIGIMILAIWGDKIRNRYAGPKLKLSLHKDICEFTSDRKKCFYHLEVTNEKKNVRAEDVAVYLLNATLEDEQSSSDPLVHTKLQLKWAHSSEQHFRNISHNTEYCDLAFVVCNDKLYFTTYVDHERLNVGFSAGQTLVVSVIAYSAGQESNTLNLRLKWDGIWRDDTRKMARLISKI